MKKIRQARNFAWGWALMAEGYMWDYLSEHVKNMKLKNLMFYRAVAVGVTGANILTDGMAFPGIKTPGCTRRGTHETGQNQGGK